MESDRLDIINFKYEFLKQTTWDISWVHENGGGDLHELTCAGSFKINVMPMLTDIGAGKMGYTLTMMQSIDSGDTDFYASWQGT